MGQETGELKKALFIYPKVEINFDDINLVGLILDIGGGGEGVIGQIKGKDVIAIDISKEELEETPDGPLKIVMDARELQFCIVSEHVRHK